MQVLVAKDLKKHFPSNFRVKTIKALDGVSFDVEQGEVFGCIGHNGAGKTTTIKILTGLIRPTSGEAEVLGKPLGDIKTLGQIGFLPERPYFYEYLTAREALRFYGELSGMKSADITRRIAELLPMLDLEHAADRPMVSYSKGMLQRLGMAQTVLHDPALVILDEPMSGLDPVGRGQIKDIIRILKKQGKSIFFSTHILSDVEELCDRVVLIAQGKLWYSGRVGELTSQYEHGVEFTLTSLGAEQKEKLAKLDGTLTIKDETTSVLFLPKTEDAQKALAQLVAWNVTVERMTPKRMSLEEIFLKEFKKEEESSRETLRDHD